MKHAKWESMKQRLKAQANRRGIKRCKECDKEYNAALYPFCPFCGISKENSHDVKDV